MTRVSPGLICLALLLSMGWLQTVLAAETNRVILRLKSGDQLTGEVLSEDKERIVLTTPWNAAIFIPKSAILEQLAVAPPPPIVPPDAGKSPADTPATEPKKEAAAVAGTEAPAEPKPVAVAKIKKPAEAPVKAKEPSHWKWNLKMGADFITGAKDRQIYSVGTGLTYTRNYKSNPKKFLRNKIEYTLQYGETDGDVSANAMAGANKLDCDIFGRFYGYGVGGGGYDTVRKIEYQYEFGPGLGYHVLAEKAVALDAELGFNYQYRQGLNGAPNRKIFQGRISQELTWEIVSKITLTETITFLPFIDDPGQFQLRMGGNVGFGIVRHLSLNLTVLNLYDTQPAPGVPNNEFQFRSSLGVNF